MRLGAKNFQKCNYQERTPKSLALSGEWTKKTKQQSILSLSCVASAQKSTSKSNLSRRAQVKWQHQLMQSCLAAPKPERGNPLRRNAKRVAC